MNEILFPVQTSRILAGFTTSAMVNKPNVVYVDLSDKALGVHKVSSRTTHNLVTPPIMPYPSAEHNGITEAWEALYPEGSINPGNKEHPLGGFGFYLRGPPEFASILKQGASEVLLSYSMAFESDFAWALGGKLPGPYGGEGDSAYGCTGGRQTDRCRCFNLRLMWRKGGGGELYAYVPNLGKNMERLKEVPPKSVQHPDYGLSVGMGAFRFRSGEWVGIAQRVKLNTVGSDDGTNRFLRVCLLFMIFVMKERLKSS